MNLEVRHLRVIAAVAEHGSVTKAASVLGLAQSALTAQLNRIDRELGTPVFVRDRHGARPTAMGRLVLSHARHILSAMERLSEEARALARRTPTGLDQIRVATVTSALGGLFVHYLHAAFPEISVTATQYYSVPATALALTDGTVDVVLAGVCGDSGLPNDGSLVWTRLAQDPVFALLRENRFGADRTSVRLAELADDFWLCGPGESCFDRCFADACAREGFTPRGISVAERAAVAELVHEGHVVGLIQPLLLDQTPGQVLAIEGEPLHWTHYVGWRNEASTRFDTDAVLDAAWETHQQGVQRSPVYVRWLAEHGS